MRSHTVILGAGATIAAIPDGDKNGKSSSVMNGLLKKLNLEEILAGVNYRQRAKIWKISIQNYLREKSALK